MPSLQELKDARARAHAQAVSFMAKAGSPENRASLDKALTEVDRLTDQIVSMEAGNRPSLRANPWNLPGEHDRARAFGKFLRCGKSTLTSEERNTLERREVRDMSEGNIIAQIGSYTGVGYFVPAGFVYDIEQATKYFAPLLKGDVVRVIETATGQPLPYPTSNDTTQEATVVGENGSVNEQDIAAVSHVPLGAWKMSSGLIKCSLELIQDAAFDLEAWLAERFGERWGRGLENLLTKGSGSNQPTGLLTAIAVSGASPVIAQGDSETTGGSQTGANSIGYSDLVNLEHSVDPTYRRGAKYMMHDTTLSAIKRILDKYGRPLWVPSVATNAPDTILGYQYVVNQSMPQIASGANTVVFGDFSKFIVRKVKDLSVLRLDELFAASGQVGFISFARVDSNLIDAGTHPLNMLEQHS